MAITSKQESILEKRDNETQNILSTFKESIPTVQKQVYNKLLLFIKELDTDKNGNIKSTAKNLKAINSFLYKDVKAILKNNKEYNASVKEFISGFGLLGKITDNYFATIDGE